MSYHFRLSIIFLFFMSMGMVSAQDLIDLDPGDIEEPEGDEPIALPYIGLNTGENYGCPNCNLEDLQWLQSAMFFLNTSDLNNSTIM